MPTVMITGLNSYVAVHTALKFLHHGWNIRGTVRTEPKASSTKSLPALRQAVVDGKVEVMILEDLVKGDFKVLLKDVDAVSVHDPFIFFIHHHEWTR